MKLRRTTWALAGALVATLALPAIGMAVTGDVTEFPIKTANSMPFGITAGPDGNVWFTESAGNNVGRITPDGTITEYAVTGAMGLYDITLGPDGKSLWMTDRAANKVFKVAPDLSDPTQKPTITAGSATLMAPRAIAARRPRSPSSVATSRARRGPVSSASETITAAPASAIQRAFVVWWSADACG